MIDCRRFWVLDPSGSWYQLDFTDFLLTTCRYLASFSYSCHGSHCAIVRSKWCSEVLSARPNLFLSQRTTTSTPADWVLPKAPASPPLSPICSSPPSGLRLSLEAFMKCRMTPGSWLSFSPPGACSE